MGFTRLGGHTNGRGVTLLAHGAEPLNATCSGTAFRSRNTNTQSSVGCGDFVEAVSTLTDVFGFLVFPPGHAPSHPQQADANRGAPAGVAASSPHRRY